MFVESRNIGAQRGADTNIESNIFAYSYIFYNMQKQYSIQII